MPDGKLARTSLLDEPSEIPHYFRHSHEHQVEEELVHLELVRHHDRFVRVEFQPHFDAALAELKEKGVRLIDETPRKGAGGAKIAFLHPKATGGVLVELCQR